MPNVMAARSGRDTTLSSAPARRRGPAKRPSRLGLLAASALRHPGRLFASAVFAAGATYIVLNALAFQTARHPAPLFAEPGSRGTGPVAVAPAPAPRVPQAVPAPAPTVPPPVPDIARAPLPPARAPIAGLPAVPPAPPPAPTLAEDVDPIGALLREGTAETTASVTPIAPDPQVARVQEALLALDYGPITRDGLFGPNTSAAIAAFERDEGLEVTGGLEPATLRALAVRSGVSID
ncbi:peptidoglycan-binding domain-containing protein [Salinarimonas sp.]|uniref:peptidoglycan-binding domain-containing protein n=1 Tax=Salinarimonas sp. TaxID=2766526 RepID=UPI0032D8B68A